MKMITAHKMLRAFMHWMTDDEFNKWQITEPFVGSIYGCMDGYARQEAIAFNEWMDTIEPDSPLTEQCRNIEAYYNEWLKRGKP